MHYSNDLRPVNALSFRSSCSLMPGYCPEAMREIVPFVTSAARASSETVYPVRRSQRESAVGGRGLGGKGRMSASVVMGRVIARPTFLRNPVF